MHTKTRIIIIAKGNKYDVNNEIKKRKKIAADRFDHIQSDGVAMRIE